MEEQWSSSGVEVEEKWRREARGGGTIPISADKAQIVLTQIPFRE